MTVCLDTDVLVDCLRGVPEARAWLNSLSREKFVVPGIVAMELLMGCRNQADIQRVQKFLKAFNIVWTESNEFSRAFDLLVRHRLASALSVPDCLIAAMALGRSLRLYTFNLKHYRIIEELDAREPYSRVEKEAGA